MSGIGVNFLSRHLAMSQTPCVTHVIFCLGVYELGMPTMTLMFDFGYSYKIFYFVFCLFFLQYLELFLERETDTVPVA